MKEYEHDLQVACVNWFRYQYPKCLIYCIPNGGHRNVVVAKKLKAEGVLSGVPDLHIPISKKGLHGLYVELKAGNNKPTENQLTIMGKLENEGYQCAVCWTIDEFITVVNDYLKE